MQLLLIVLTVILVGIAAVIGIFLVGSNIASANADRVVSDLLDMGYKARSYFTKPEFMSGGEQDFSNITMGDVVPNPPFTGTVFTNDNGSYSIDSKEIKLLILEGVGRHDSDKDGTNATFHLYVSPDSIKFTTISR
ncbi:MAG: hypothetical protein U5R06_18735 [candidate division KSB1 bacterium]|nr:hypothetical protein [candidate division KSB1 bacterium]